MVHDLPTMQQLLRQLQHIPYLTTKNIYRVAHYFLEMDPKKAELFIKVLQEAQAHIIKCSTCFVWKERDRDCFFCSHPQRDQATVCVVETWYDVQAVEKTGGFTGVYHVLGGAICPLEGVGPDQLTIMPLKERVAQKNIKEVILAMNQTLEGEATAAYIARLLQDYQGDITCLARGVPVGGTLEFMDRVTILKALKERRAF